jgi:hypothetical protein
MKKLSKGLDFVYRYFVLAFLAVAGFVGLMSVLAGDRLTVGVISAVVVLVCVRELSK